VVLFLVRVSALKKTKNYAAILAVDTKKPFVTVRPSVFRGIFRWESIEFDYLIYA